MAPIVMLARRGWVSVLPATSGPGIVDVGDPAGRRDHPDRPEGAGVLGDRGVGDVQEAVVDGPGRDPEGGVDRPPRLRRAARVVGHHLVALDVHVDRDGIGLALDAVVLDHVLEAVLAVGERGELGAHPALRVVHEVLAGAGEDLAAVFLDDLDDAGDAQVDAADHRPQIAVVLARRAAVGEQQLPDLVDVLARLLDLDRRHAQALVEDLGRLAAEGARHHAADLGDVADADREALELAVDEERLEEGVLGAVQAAAVGIVVEDDVAVLKGLERDLLGAGLDQERHAADHRRAELGAGDHVALGVGERAGEVEALVEDRRVGRLHQKDAHLAADRHHGGIEDLHQHHVGRRVGRRQRGARGLDGQLRLHDRQAEVAPLPVAQSGPLDAPGRAVDASLAVTLAGNALAIDEEPAVRALDVALDVVAVGREPHRADAPAAAGAGAPARNAMGGAGACAVKARAAMRSGPSHGRR